MPFRNEHLVRDFYDHMISNGIGVVAVWWCGENDICGTPGSEDAFVKDVFAADYCKVTFEHAGELTAGCSRWVTLDPYASDGEIICDHSVHTYPRELASSEAVYNILNKDRMRFEETIAAWDEKHNPMT